MLLGFEPGALPRQRLDQIQALVPEMCLQVTEDRGVIEGLLGDIEIVVRRFPHDLLPKAPKLRWFQQWGAGADWLLRYPEIGELGFSLTNASGVHAIPISEHIMSYLLAFARQLHVAIRAQGQHRWEEAEQRPVFELAGQTLLLIGVGDIGRRTAHVASSLGMRVLGVRRNPQIAEPSIEAMFGPDRLLEILPQADWVVLTVPLTRETKDLIGERELAAMKPSAHLVNVGRGGTVQETALTRALQERLIAGAGLDVFEGEPLPADSPLWELPNVIITSHYAGSTPYYEERAMAIFIDNLRRYRDGEPLHNLVDKKLGY